MEPILINDPRVLSVPIEECGEPLVDLRDYPLLVSDSHPVVGYRCLTQLHCREGVAGRLLMAEEALPDGLRLYILEAHRTVEYQALCWESGLGKLRERCPDASEETRAMENARFVAPPWNVPPHSTGGALDLVLVDSDGEELDMGCRINTEGPLSRTAAEGVSKAAKKNRRILLASMEEAGFVNYPYEWWHYSYGDRYWALSSGADAGLYGSI